MYNHLWSHDCHRGVVVCLSLPPNLPLDWEKKKKWDIDFLHHAVIEKTHQNQSFENEWLMKPCYWCIDCFLNAVDVFVLVTTACFYLNVLMFSFPILFTVCPIHASHSTASESAGVVYTTKSKPEISPGGGKSQQVTDQLESPPLSLSFLQLDQCIMSWHGPSLCADSSVSLGDPETFISQSQPASSPPAPRLLLSLFPEPEMVSVRSGHKGKKWSANRFLIPYRGACGSSKTLDTSGISLGWHGFVVIASVLLLFRYVFILIVHSQSKWRF